MRKPYILLVEDEPEIRKVLTHFLSGHGYEVDVAATVSDAKACLVGQTYDLVITDWRLPDGDGRLVADWAAELGAKTFLMSGYLSYMPGGHSQDHTTLMKPIQPAEFIAAVKRSIDSRIQSRGQGTYNKRRRPEH